MPARVVLPAGGGDAQPEDGQVLVWLLPLRHDQVIDERDEHLRLEERREEREVRLALVAEERRLVEVLHRLACREPRRAVVARARLDHEVLEAGEHLQEVAEEDLPQRAVWHEVSRVRVDRRLQARAVAAHVGLRQPVADVVQRLDDARLLRERRDLCESRRAALQQLQAVGDAGGVGVGAARSALRPAARPGRWERLVGVAQRRLADELGDEVRAQLPLVGKDEEVLGKLHDLLVDVDETHVGLKTGAGCNLTGWTHARTHTRVHLCLRIHNNLWPATDKKMSEKMVTNRTEMLKIIQIRQSENKPIMPCKMETRFDNIFL